MISAKTKNRLFWIGAGSIMLYALLLIPDIEPAPPSLALRQPFIWNQDERWEALESTFVAFRSMGCVALQARLESELAVASRLIDRVAAEQLTADSPPLIELEGALFALAPLVAVCPSRAREYLDLVGRMRTALKDQSLRWDMDDLTTRQRVYRLLYGGRAATEEMLLQLPHDQIPPLMKCRDEPSRTPAAEVLGVRIHSGDILISRGGAPTSALIARGNDYAGNFSHVAIAYVDPNTLVPWVVESHIEKGVAVASLPQYLEDTKLRVMVLRLRSDLAPVLADSFLPHRAAELALKSGQERHIPYDFAMNVQDSGEMFCSEVVSIPYATLGVRLWMSMSTISSPGVAALLAGFGVRNFVTQEPSDLEYDPQLGVVAEWRDPETLLKDHMDNAIIDALIEGAEAGEQIPVRWYLLPLARIVKLYSVFLNGIGKVGPIPEGMSATSGLRHVWLVDRHAKMKAALLVDAERFKRKNGYAPPYWELLKMARRARVVE